MIPWPWLNQYHKRRALGLCVADYCPEYAGRMCPRHGSQKQAYSKIWNKNDYLRRKLAGICVAKGCSNSACETSFYCASHLSRYCAHVKRYRKTKKGREKRRVNQRRVKRERAELGICTSGSCPNELSTTTLCEVHRQKKMENAAVLRRARGVSESKHKCTVCRRPGHNAQSCRVRGHEDDMLPVEHYAVARTCSALEMSE